MDNRVVTVSVDANAAGYKLGVSEATIVLGVNAIPLVELQCAPSMYARQTPLKPDVKTPTLKDYGEVYKKLSVLAEGLSKTGNATFTVKEDRGETDTIKLNNWILTDVGMSSVSATAAPYMTVILQHPICKLTKVGSIYETPKGLLNKEIADVNKDEAPFLTVVKRTYDFVADADNMFWKASNEYPPIYRHALKENEFNPNAYLRDDTSEHGDTFLNNAKVNPGRMAQAEASMVLPVEGGTSTWDMILSSAGHLLLSVVQDEECNYTKPKLVLEPARPWKQSTIELGEDWCVTTDLPGSDPFKISGVMARKLGPYAQDVTLGILRNGNLNNTESMASEVMYVPPTSTNPKISDGRIMKTSSPALLEMTFRSDSPFGGAITTSNIKDEADRAIAYDPALKAYCKAVYEISTLSLCRATARMALYFHDVHGKLILPGNTCTFYAKGVLYYGYIQKVAHHISSEGGCSTTIVMSHVRTDESYKINGQTAIEYGAQNAAWS